MADRFAQRVRAGTHHDRNPLGFRIAAVFEQAIAAAGRFAEPVHALLHDLRQTGVIRVGTFPPLEVDVRVLRGPADTGVVRIQRTGAVRTNQILVDHVSDLLIRQQHDLADLVRSPKAVKEVDERHARLQRRGLGDQRHVVRFLHRRGSQLRKAGIADGGDVGMVAEDRQTLRRQRTRRHMNDRRRQLAGDLVHVRNHQQQALRRREGGRHRAGLQRAVHRPGRSTFALHLRHQRDLAPDVPLAFRRPLVGQFGHRR